jgi:hypothetical protein
MKLNPEPSLLDQWVRIRVFVPKANVASIRSVLDRLAKQVDHQGLFVGTLGNYDSVRYELSVIEHFVPNSQKGAKPHSDTPMDLVCLETWCSFGLENEVVKQLREQHPYEHPVIEVSTVWLAKAKPRDCRPR